MHIFAEKFAAEGANVKINAMHPGFVRTNTGTDNGPLYRFFKQKILDRLSKDPSIPAEALYYLGVSPELKNVTDRFFHLTRIEELAPPAKDRKLAEHLWDKTLEIIASRLGGWIIK